MQLPNKPIQPTLTNPTARPTPRAEQAPTNTALAGSTPPLAGAGASAKAPEAPFTGEQTIVDQFANRITASWHKSAASIFELAKDCAAADKELNTAAKRALIARLPFDRVTFSKIAKIGHDSRLLPLMHQLPPSFSTLYELTGFDEATLATGLKSGAINPRATRQEIISFGKEASSDQEGTNKLKRPKPCLKRLKTLWNEASEDEKKKFRQWESNGCPEADGGAPKPQ